MSARRRKPNRTTRTIAGEVLSSSSTPIVRGLPDLYAEMVGKYGFDPLKEAQERNIERDHCAALGHIYGGGQPVGPQDAEFLASVPDNVALVDYARLMAE